MRASRVAQSGRGKPVGGIMPARSLRTTFSPISACCPRWATSSLSRARFPVNNLALWQPTQYWSRSARALGGAGAVWPRTRPAGITTKRAIRRSFVFTDPPAKPEDLHLLNPNDHIILISRLEGSGDLPMDQFSAHPGSTGPGGGGQLKTFATQDLRLF